MRFASFAALAAACALLASSLPAGAKDYEHKRTRIIIQKRSYLDPGTEVLPGDRHDRDYAFSPTFSATSVLDNTASGRNQSALPGPWTLSGKNNPWLKF